MLEVLRRDWSSDVCSSDLSLPLLHDFGRIVALNVAIALLSALVILPPMLVWADKRNWVSRGLVPADQLDLSRAPSTTPTTSAPGASPSPVS
jgi:uncharacterized protein